MGLMLCVSALGWVAVSKQAVRQVRSLSDWLSTVPESVQRQWVWAFGALLAVVLIGLRLHQYANLQIMWDTAVESNVAWHMVHGPRFFNSWDNRSHLSQHFAPVFILLAPFYWVWESPLTLLVIQSIGIGLGAVAVWFLTIRRGTAPSLACVLALIYACNWYLHQNNYQDMHRTVLAIPMGLWLLYCIEVNRPIRASMLTALLLSLEESLAPPVVGMGIYLSVFHAGWRVWGALVAFSAAGYFVVVTMVVMPMLSPEQELFLWKGNYSHLGSDLPSAILNILVHPFRTIDLALFEHRQYIRVLYLLASLALLPLLAPRQSLLSIAPLGMMLVSGQSGHYRLGHHYTAPALPFLLYAAAYGMARASTWLRRVDSTTDRRWKWFLVAAMVCLTWNVYRIPSYELWVPEVERSRAAFELVAFIPPAASLATDVRFASLVVNRHRLCKLGASPDELCDWRVEGAAPAYYAGKTFVGPGWEPEYLMIDVDQTTYPPSELSRRQRLVESLSTGGGGFDIIKTEAGIVLLRRSPRV